MKATAAMPAPRELEALPSLGSGIGYRDPWFNDLMGEEGGQADFLEITADHFLDAPAWKMRELDALAERFTLIPHALDLSIGTAEGIDEVRLVQADAAVVHDEVVFAAELLFRKVAIGGRGGTDFGPALELLSGEAKRMGQPFTVAYLTDLDGRFGEAPLHLDVLWVVPHQTNVTPPFGRVLQMTTPAH